MAAHSCRTDNISFTQQSGSSMTTGLESEKESDPWIPLIEEAKKINNTAFEEM